MGDDYMLIALRILKRENAYIWIREFAPFPVEVVMYTALRDMVDD